MPRTRPAYPAEYKAELVRLVVLLGEVVLEY